MKTIILIFLCSIVFFSCNPSAPKEEKHTASYTSKEIGWSIEIPEGFKLLSQSKIEANHKKGKEAIGEVYDGEVNMDSLKNLINFQKNVFNQFNATIEPYVEKRAGAYEENNQLVKKLIFDTYRKQQIKIDTSSTTAVVAKLKFRVFQIKIYGPDRSLIMNQLMYTTLTKGYDFSVNINYNNEQDRKLLMDAFKNSRFEK